MNANLEFALVELQRRLANSMRVGIVTEVDYIAARARVTVGTLLTQWLPWLVQRAGGDREWAAPELGDQVIIVSAGDLAQGIIIGSLYSEAKPANGDRATHNRIDFADGAFVEYDRAAHRYTIHVPSGSEVRIGNADAADPVARKSDLQAIVDYLNSHTHGGIEPGGGSTSPPNTATTPACSLVCKSI